MARPEVRLGVITPSSNTNAEPTTYRLLAEIPSVTAHFSRFGLPKRLDVTITAELLEPAALLIAEAGVDAMVFHGTSGSWMGVDGDRALCRRLGEVVGVPVTTATLATLSALAASGGQRLGLAFPGRAAIAQQIAAEYRRLGHEFTRFSCAEELETNAQIGALSEAEIERLLDAACEGVDTVVALGTNLRAASLAARAESRNDVLVIDSAAAVVWELLRLTGVTARPRGWGRLFELAPVS
jgi:maleate isomerase